MWDWFKRLLFVKCILQGCTSSAKDKTKRLHVQVSFFPDLFIMASITNRSWLVCYGIKQCKPTNYAGKSVCVLLNVVWLVLAAINFATCAHSLRKLLSKLPALCVSFLLSGGWSSSKRKMCGNFFHYKILKKWFIDLHVNVAHWQQPCSLCRLRTNSFWVSTINVAEVLSCFQFEAPIWQ